MHSPEPGTKPGLKTCPLSSLHFFTVYGRIWRMREEAYIHRDLPYAQIPLTNHINRRATAEQNHFWEKEEEGKHSGTSASGNVTADSLAIYSKPLN